MRLLIGLLMTLVGIGFAVYGIGMALMEVIGLYQGALNDPLSGADGAEKAVSNNMLQHLVTGAIGIPFLLIGKIILVSAYRRRIHRR